MTTTATQDRTLYGCPSWCTFDHESGPYMDPGDHKRDLAGLAGEEGDAVGLYVHPSEPTHVTVFLGREGAEHYPATRETVEHLRDLARMFREGADQLSGLLQSGEVQR